MGIAEDVQDVTDQITAYEQAWGLNAGQRAIKVLVRAVRAIAVRADARADALEARVTVLEQQAGITPPQ